jgi:hypothetical protein
MPHLPPAHHEISKHNSSNEQMIKVKQANHPKFEFKSREVNDSSQSNHGTDLNPKPHKVQLEDQKVKKAQEGHL